MFESLFFLQKLTLNPIESRKSGGGGLRINYVHSAFFRSSAKDPDPQKYADPRIWIQGVKYQPKTAKKTFLLLKPKSELLKK